MNIKSQAKKMGHEFVGKLKRVEDVRIKKLLQFLQIPGYDD